MNFFSCPKVFGKTSESSEYTFLRQPPKNQYFYYMTESSEIILELEIPSVDPVELKAFFVFTELVKTGCQISEAESDKLFYLEIVNIIHCPFLVILPSLIFKHFQCKTVFSHSKMPHWLNRLESAIEC